MKYAESGVDYKKESKTVEMIVNRVSKTFKNRKGKWGRFCIT